jgi:hypothetical protein
MSFADELSAIYKRFGELTRRQVVDLARTEPETYPALHSDLYERFTDEELADQRRLERAGEIIRSITIVREEPAEETTTTVVVVRQYVSTVADDNRRRYLTVEDVAADPTLTEDVLKEMRRDVAALERKYAAFVRELHVEFRERAVTSAPDGTPEG